MELSILPASSKSWLVWLLNLYQMQTFSSLLNAEGGGGGGALCSALLVDLVGFMSNDKNQRCEDRLQASAEVFMYCLG